jgi:hypothetical protein
MCRCVWCADCGGTGYVWFAFPGPDRGGRYLGRHRSDDLDEMDLCQSCSGGITEVCDECQDAMDQEDRE